MELQEFVTTAIKAIGKGIGEGTEQGNFEAFYPTGPQSPGVEFDLTVETKNDKIEIVDSYHEDNTFWTRIKFTVPMANRK